jgi:hypothetical protein
MALHPVAHPVGRIAVQKTKFVGKSSNEFRELTRISSMRYAFVIILYNARQVGANNEHGQNYN